MRRNAAMTRRSMMKSLGVLIVAAAGVAAGAAAAQPAEGDVVHASDQRKAALLFSYEVDRGRGSEFEAGYKAHLKWHADHDDHLPWYGWYVISGERVGAFVDGTFGETFEAIDRRPALAEDGAHFAEYVAPYARPLVYSVYELWPAPSTASALEDRKPTPFVDVYKIEVAHGDAQAFERRLAAVSKQRGDGAAVTWYRAMLGAATPSYLVMAPRRSWAELAARGGGFDGLLSAAYDADAGDLERLARMITAIDGESWVYRRDLSYFPDEYRKR